MEPNLNMALAEVLSCGVRSLPGGGFNEGRANADALTPSLIAGAGLACAAWGIWSIAASGLFGAAASVAAGAGGMVAFLALPFAAGAVAARLSAPSERTAWEQSRNSCAAVLAAIADGRLVINEARAQRLVADACGMLRFIEAVSSPRAVMQPLIEAGQRP